MFTAVRGLTHFYCLKFTVYDIVFSLSAYGPTESIRCKSYRMFSEGINPHCGNRTPPPSSSFAQLHSTKVDLCLATAYKPGDPATGVARHHGDGHYKHRCPYCRKGFHGESALQIHLRSHTG